MSARPAMRTPDAIPGFGDRRPNPAPPATEPSHPPATEPEAQSPDIEPTPPPQSKSSGGSSRTKPPRIDLQADRGGLNTTQVGFYALQGLRRHYDRLVFELKQDGEKITLSELLNAALWDGPADADEAQKLIDRYRENTRPPARQ